MGNVGATPLCGRCSVLALRGKKLARGGLRAIRSLARSLRIYPDRGEKRVEDLAFTKYSWLQYEQAFESGGLEIFCWEGLCSTAFHMHRPMQASRGADSRPVRVAAA